jgi:aspartyl-tRNA(Asn)/glutamyl-tRNA(Gln) amidotransferase subunit C
MKRKSEVMGKITKVRVDSALLEKVAANARLILSEEEKKEFLGQMQEILDAFSVLDGLDTGKARPSFQPIEQKNRWREDLREGCLTNDEALSNTQHRKDGYFKGPKVM